MNSQFFSIDSIIGKKQNFEDETETEHPVNEHDNLEENERNTPENSPKSISNEVNHRRLKIPSYHTSNRDRDYSVYKASSTSTCHTSTCNSPNGGENNANCNEKKVSSGLTCPNSCKALPKQKRLSLTKHQLGELEKCFLKNYYPTEATREDLAQRLGLSHARVKVWFQNRRAKWQRNQKMKSEWQSFLHNPFTTALGLSHHRLMLQQQQQQHQLLADAHSKDFDPQCLQTPMPSFYSPLSRSSMAFMLPRQDLMSYAMGKPSLQAIDAYMLAKQAAESENNMKVCLSDESDSEETSKSPQNTHSSSIPSTSSRLLSDKQIGLQPGQFWW